LTPPVVSWGPDMVQSSLRISACVFTLALAPREIASAACPSCDYELPSSYTIANGMVANQQASYFGETFDVYSKPFSTKYGEVLNSFNYDRDAPTTVPLPEAIVQRYNGSVMAITGFEVNIVEISEDGTESLVPCTHMYNHHWSNLMLGADAEPLAADTERDYWTYPGAATGTTELSHPHRGERWHRGTSWSEAKNQLAKTPGGRHKGARGPGDDPLATAPTATFFSEGNGNEHRLSFHGYAPGYAQLIASPTHFAPGLMFINTKDVVGDGHNGHGSMVPSVSLQPGDSDYSPLLECPCGTRRDMDVDNSKIDGVEVSFGCHFDGEGTGRGLARMAERNDTSCQMATLHGGSKCCEDGMILLDDDQIQPEQVSTYSFKTTFYYEDATPVHKNLFRVYWQYEMLNNEWDVPACPAGMPPEECIVIVENEGIANETLWAADPTAVAGWSGIAWPEDGSGIQLLYAGGHCHVGCISLDLINMNTGQVICHQEAVYAPEGATGDAMDEPGYALSIPPCVWGDEDDLQDPYVIMPTDKLQVVAKYNSTRLRRPDDPSFDPAAEKIEVSHYAVMSMFQMRASYI